jgi:hypothetical protein
MLPATSQKADVRPISFVLEKSGVPSVALDLAIRPEEMTRSDPSRLAVMQTLGGAWADDFGEGIAQINMAGTTGWRSGGFGGDGEARFLQLRTLVYDGWHNQRKQARLAGQDPSNIALVLADSLNSTIDIVAPMSFALRRSKSRPLLMQFQISLLVLGQQSPAGASSSTSSDLTSKILASLTASVSTITSIAARITGYINANFAAPLVSFIGSANAVYGQVTAAIQAGQSVVASVLHVASLISQAGTAIARTVNAVLSLPDVVRGDIAALGSAFSNIFCGLQKIGTQKIYQNYMGIYGASNCSSTSGGSPISPFANSNTFAAVAPTSTGTGIVLSSPATQSLQVMATSDPVLAPMSLTAIQTNLAAVNAGLVTP